MQQVGAPSPSPFATPFRWAARADVWLPFLVGVGCVSWVFVVPHPSHHSAADAEPEFELGLLMILSAPLLLAAALTYGVLSVLVRRPRLWAVALLSVVAAVQGLAMTCLCFFFLSDVMHARPIGLFCGAYAALLLFTAALGGRFAVDLWSHRTRRAGFFVKPVPDPLL